jgi:hypothetical protein
MSQKCEKCPIVDTCEVKEMEMHGYLGLDATYRIMDDYSKGASVIPNRVTDARILGIDISLHEVNPNTINKPFDQIDFIRRITNKSAEEISRKLTIKDLLDTKCLK